MNLNDWYRKFNRKYFGDKLPSAKVDWANYTQGLMAKTYLMKERVGDGHKLVGINIYINRMFATLPEELAQMHLLHEMAHVSVGEKYHHGKVWKQEMIRLAKRGAFDGRW